MLESLFNKASENFLQANQYEENLYFLNIRIRISPCSAQMLENRPATLLKRDTNTVFSYEYCEIFKNSYFIGHSGGCFCTLYLTFNYKMAGVYKMAKHTLKIFQQLSHHFQRDQTLTNQLLSNITSRSLVLLF